MVSTNGYIIASFIKAALRMKLVSLIKVREGSLPETLFLHATMVTQIKQDPCELIVTHQNKVRNVNHWQDNVKRIRQRIDSLHR